MINIEPPKPKAGCVHLEWKNVSTTPEDMPEMQAFCKKLKGKLPRKKDYSPCAVCIFYEARMSKEKPK